jgi:hypothetical protein
VQEFPHALSAWWFGAQKLLFVVYYAAIFYGFRRVKFDV